MAVKSIQDAHLEIGLDAAYLANSAHTALVAHRQAILNLGPALYVEKTLGRYLGGQKVQRSWGFNVYMADQAERLFASNIEVAARFIGRQVVGAECDDRLSGEAYRN